MDRRAGELMEEYRGKADKVDRLLGEEEEGRGRVRRRLDQFGMLIGIVSGLFNEASSDTMMLLDVQGGEAGQGDWPHFSPTGGGEGKSPGGAEDPAVALKPEGGPGLHAGPLSPNR